MRGKVYVLITIYKIKKMIEKTKITQYILGRQLINYDDVRGKYIHFDEHLHDLIRLGQAKRFETPLSVHWAVTLRCNLACKHCYAYGNRKQTDLNTEQCKHILDVLKEYNCFDIAFEGGEPFYREDFEEILSYAKKKKFVVDILTNGTLINKQKARTIIEILDAEIDRIQVSIDGSKKENDFIRGEEAYYKTLQGLENLKDFPNVTVNTVVTNTNIDSLDTMCNEVFNVCDVKFVHLSPLISVDRSKGRLSLPEIEHAIDVFINLREKYGQKISGSTVPDRLLFAQFEEYIPEQYKKCLILGCCAGRSKMYINADGSISPCAFLNAKNLRYELPLEQFLETVWPNAWNDLVERNYRLSQKYSESKCYYDFCPGFGADENGKTRM